MGKVLRLKLGIRFLPVSAYLPDSKASWRLSKLQTKEKLNETLFLLNLCLFFCQEREIPTCACSFCVFFAPSEIAMSALVVGWRGNLTQTWNKPTRPFDQNMTGGISTSLLFKRPNPRPFLLLPWNYKLFKNTIPTKSQACLFQRRSLAKLVSEILLYPLLEYAISSP